MNRLMAWLHRRESAPIFPIAVALMFASLLWRPISDTDIFWQLKLGELTLQHGIPNTEPFLSPQPDRPHVPVAWLAQVLYASLRQCCGWVGLQIIDFAIWMGGYTLVAAAMLRERRGTWPAIAALFLAHMVAFAHASLRPQSFSILGFALVLLLARSHRSLGNKLVLGTIVLVFWQNAHPSVIAAALWLGVLACGEWWQWLRHRGGEKRWATSALCCAAAIATVATPAGFDIFPLSRDNAEASKWFRVGEWLPLWDEALTEFLKHGNGWGFAEYFFNTGRLSGWIAVILTLFGFAVRWRRLHFAEALASIPLLILTLMVQRFSLFWCLAMIPIWFEMMAPMVSEERPPIPWGRKTRIAVLGAVWLLAVAVPLLLRPSTWVSYHPFSAVSALQEAGVRGTIYCNYFQGGTLIDFGFPDWKVTHDGRYYLYSIRDWEAHAAARIGEVPLEVIEQQFRPDAFFLRSGVDAGLIERLRGSPRWQEIFADEQGAVFVRATVGK